MDSQNPFELSVENISKNYGDVLALQRISISFRSGTVHVVVGENGAGKSTLMNLIAGYIKPTGGRICLCGERQPTVEFPLGDPMAVKALGVGMVHQHFTLVPALSILENLQLALLDSISGFTNPGVTRERASRLASDLGWELDLNQKVESVPVGVQQRVEILKALLNNERVVIFDEPTATLSPDEADGLLEVLRRLAEQGKLVILIAHKLTEVLKIADFITVLRKGELISQGPREEYNPQRLASDMVGELPVFKKRTVAHQSTESAISIRNGEIRNDDGKAVVKELNLEAKRGQILGIGGVDGNGQLELAEALAGVRPFSRGEVNFSVGMDEIAYIPADRQRDGLAVALTIRDNHFVRGNLHPEFHVGPWLRVKRVLAWSQGLIDRFQIKANSPMTLVEELSGGNQQKVVVSRELDRKPQVIVAMNPIRGLDVRAAQFVHEQLESMKLDGAAVILISADLDELAEMADETTIISRGELRRFEGAVSVVGGE